MAAPLAGGLLAIIGALPGRCRLAVFMARIVNLLLLIFQSFLIYPERFTKFPEAPKKTTGANLSPRKVALLPNRDVL